MSRPPNLSEDDRRYKWPGIESAYEYVLPSYQWMISRIDAADSRIQTLLAFIATVSFAAPTLMKTANPQLSFGSPEPTVAFAMAGLAVLIGLISRVNGGVMLLTPVMLWEKWTRYPEVRFKARLLYYASKHFASNEQLLNRKRRASFAMTSLFFGELVLFALWGAS